MTTTSRWATATALLAGGILAAGCGAPANSGPKPAKAGMAKHDHPEEGPHHGALVEWGDNDELHAEFTVDHKKKEARVYILGPDAKKPAPIKTDKVILSVKAPAFTLDLKPEPQKDDPPGTASVFVGTHDHLGKEQEFAGTLSATIDGKPYSNDFKEYEPHDHKHEKK